MRPFLEEIYGPICPSFPEAPRTQAFKRCKEFFLVARLRRPPAAETKSFPRAWDSHIPQGEDADGVRDLDANPSTASVGKPEEMEKTSKASCYHVSAIEAVWQMRLWQ